MQGFRFVVAGLVALLLAIPIRAADVTRSHRTTTFDLVLHADTQTLAGLAPLGEREFDFLPDPKSRRGAGHFQLGDLTLRTRAAGGEWREFSTHLARTPVRALPADGDTLAAADITSSLGVDAPVAVERRWRRDGRALVLSFTLSNPTTTSVEIGALGFPLPFDNTLTGRSLEQAHARASFADPSIANDAGYVQVTRVNGHGPALLVLPEGRTPIEAWRPLEDAMKRSHTFEGFFEWMSASRAYAEREWKDADTQWNPPTSFTLQPGEKRLVGLRFVLAPSIRSIENTLIAERRPVVVGIPGYVVPTDTDATLFVSAPSAISRLDVTPAGALSFTRAESANGWTRYAVRGVRWGRARLAITYADGSSQTVSYFVTKPAADVVRVLGAFTTQRQWFDDPRDPFGRAPAILSFDRDTDRIVTQDTRAWIAGMSDEGGAGSWVAAMLKQLDNPEPAEVAKLERVVDETVWGKLQIPAGARAGGVKRSLFWYDPKTFPDYYDATADWTTWTSWEKDHTDKIERSYNYPHVAAGHWVLYRLARHRTGLVKTHDWRWYLDRAALTAHAMMRDAPYYAQFGQMEGEVFLEILLDLQREGLAAQARALEAAMKKRADHWLTLPYPFGSEMPWDSTGQPEVYAWMRYFGHARQAAMTREVILGYDPAIPSWGYNGNARRYWDFLYGGKLRRIERQIHHYGSALNAVPLFDAYRENPDDFHLLRVAYGGLLGALTNIDERGFGSAAFHSWPDQMRFDPLTGDYGMGFFGHAYATASYLVNHPTFGWLGFGGNVTRDGDVVRLQPTDSARTRVFIVPARLWITLAAGRIEAADYSTLDGSVSLRLAPADAHAPAARMIIEAGGERSPFVPAGATPERGMLKIPLGANPTLIKIPRSH
jgi:hypothetical protein